MKRIRQSRLYEIWFWCVAAVVFVLAKVVYHLTRKRNGWAASKILRWQGDAEQRIQKLNQHATRELRQLDLKHSKQRRKLLQKKQKQLKRIKQQHEQLSSAALKKQTLENLDEPL